MSLGITRFSQLRWLQTVVCVAAMIGGAVLIGLGVLGYGDSPQVWLAAAGGFVLFAAIVVLTITPLLLKLEATAHRRLEEQRDVNDRLARQTAVLEQLVENTRLSDGAKSLAHRQEEIDALRQAIRDTFRTERWTHARSLVRELADRFGYTEEARELSEELEAARTATVEVKLAEAIQLVETHFEGREWIRAQVEIDRLKHLFPADHRIGALEKRLASLRGEHKAALRQEWDEAVKRSDTDHAIELLRELDPFLSPADVQELERSARTVFKEKLLQLGVRFRLAVKAKRWQDALDAGLEIIREFPNVRMAHEVREMLDVLRERARHPGRTAAAGTHDV
jgi:hypothetical protein